MNAGSLERYNKQGALRLGDVPEPELRDDEVLVKIHASGVNALDLKIAKGEFQALLPYRTPFVLGHDAAGVVTRIGAKVRTFKPGDEVYSRPDDHRIGAFATEANAPGVLRFVMGLRSSQVRKEAKRRGIHTPSIS